MFVREVPDVDRRRFNADGGERSAHLASMIGAVVQCLRKPDTHRGMGLGAVGAPPDHNSIRVEVLCKE